MAELRNFPAVRRLVTAAGATAALLAAGLGGMTSAQAGVAGGAARISPPRYYLEQSLGARNPAVRATATGAVTGMVGCPAAGQRVSQLVAADSETFFLACQTTAGHTVLYRFRLTASGRAVGYSRVRGGTLDTAVGSLAASADGSTLAVTVSSGGPGGEVVVISTRTGAHAVWRDGPAGSGMVRLRLQQLALTGNGQELVVFGAPKCLKGSPGNVCRANGQEARAVSPARAGGSLSRSRLIMRQSAITSLREGFINYVTVTPDGRSLIVAVVSGGAKINGGFVAVDQVSAATGRRTRQLYRMNTGNGFSYQFVSADPSGRYVLFDAGTTRTDVNGWIDRGKLIRLRPAGSDVFNGAW